MFGDFVETNYALKRFLTEEEFMEDQQCWFKPKEHEANIFIVKTERWLKVFDERDEQANLLHYNEIKPSDRISAILSTISRKSGKPASESGSAVSSTVSSIRLKAEVEKAEILAKVSELK